ncbi:MAG: winged helix-turn-helix transcriptional regulator [Erysipelotrichaceae bacterium]|nr:winged helix-turn-helix transcriptional regulator [Erysipelotrichaceae bacterium]
MIVKADSLSNRTPYDDQINHKAEISDLNFTLIKSYLHEIDSDLYNAADSMDFVELCRNMHLLSELPEYTKPRNVALMFFNPEPDKFFPYAQIDVVQFPEGEGGDQIIEQTFKGPLHEQLRAALRYIRNVIITEKVVKYPDRAEADRFFNYPYAAIEEALANAVYHKAYDEREPIEVRVTENMIEIVSHPGPDRSVTIEGLKEFKVYSRRYRNRRIGEFLKELHLTEGRNTGFKKILNALKANGSPLPEFETDEAHDYFVSRFFIHEGFINDELVSDADKNETSLKQVLKQVLKQSKYKKMLPIIEKLDQNGQISVDEAMTVTGKSRTTVWRYLQALVNAEVVQSVGETNNVLYTLKHK